MRFQFPASSTRICIPEYGRVDWRGGKGREEEDEDEEVNVKIGGGKG